ncbi:DUF2243 domain-containing protein [Pannus brasiliensis CCIBt3594]|uniref:DUF2243 domain-containing protein n=1 Tax=Pannus brasiliensis CCIBt3594 TaxID=1427578 RepID=A0AAW9QWA8_9CHRO
MTTPIESDRTYRPLIVAAFLIGVGQGGFFDGIVFHQLLQWHPLFSEVRSTVTIADLEIDTLGDGLFHLFDRIVTAIGIGYLWRVCRDRLSPLSTPVFLGSLAIGAGTFNVVEGILDHHLLGIHHVKPGPYQLFWDLGFLAIGFVAIVAGWSIVRQFSKR